MNAGARRHPSRTHIRRAYEKYHPPYRSWSRVVGVRAARVVDRHATVLVPCHHLGQKVLASSARLFASFMAIVVDSASRENGKQASQGLNVRII